MPPTYRGWGWDPGMTTYTPGGRPRMTECPNCGSRMMLPYPTEIHHCPHCGVLVEPKKGLIGAILGDVQVVKEDDEANGESAPGEVTLSEREAEDKWLREHPDYYSRGLEKQSIEDMKQLKEVEAAGEGSSYEWDERSTAECAHCHATIKIPTARYCPYCGARVDDD